MSEILLGVLRMPPELFWNENPLTRMQHDSIRYEAADEIERLQTEMQWQPIDTAPTDGTNVLVLLKSGSVMQAEFWAFWEPVYFSATKIEPTHWMPLPLPPAEVNP